MKSHLIIANVIILSIKIAGIPFVITIEVILAGVTSMNVIVDLAVGTVAILIRVTGIAEQTLSLPSSGCAVAIQRVGG
jgi:hypothetical protein